VSLSRNEAAGIRRFAADVTKEFKRVCAAINDLARIVLELDERLKELEDYVADQDRPGDRDPLGG
jgi:hypothetical protein